jgi:O-acetyl-ADP-ribose deacetylase (regulator of RNase III)/ADP-ribose pyrophosphatase YjhB (NUDIX family)
MDRKIKNTVLKVTIGDITELNVNAIVNAANNQLVMGGGVAGAIKKKGGQSIQDEATKLAPIPPGEAVVTGAGNLKAKYVIHAATMGMDFETNETKIRACVANSLKRAEEKALISIAFPALGCGVGGFSIEKVAKIMAEEVLLHLKKTSTLESITFVLIDEPSAALFETSFSGHLDYVQGKMNRNPIPTADIIIDYQGGIVLVKRKNPPFGWAIPGGFLEYGETLETCAARETKEETNLELNELAQFHTYSDPARDPRHHTVTTVFTAKGKGILKADSDAKEAKVFKHNELPSDIAFDHKEILNDYFRKKY